MIRVLLADDHALVRAGIRSLLKPVEGIEVVAETGDGREVVPLSKAHGPDVVLLDITMPGLNGLEAAAQLSKECPKVRVLILSMHKNEEFVAQALRLGAVGYLLKDALPQDLELALRAAARGESYLSPALTKSVIADYVNSDKAHGETARVFDQLSPRQREILQLIAEGRSTKEMARMLQLSVKTVEAHRTELMRRLDIHDIAGLVRYAIRVGLVAPDR